MALDKLVDSSQLNGALSSTADAIRAKTGGTDNLTWDMDTGFAVQIGDISTGIDTSDATATAGDILDGKTAYANGEKIEGTIPMKTPSDLSASGKTVTVPAGYYASQATKDVATGSATTPATTVTANPSISVNASGLIRATASAKKSVTPTVSAGYVSSGTSGTITVFGTNTSQLSTQAGGTIAPTESEQTAVDAEKYTTGAVKVGAISSTYVGSGIPQNDSDDLTASGATVTAPAGYYAENATKTIGSGTVVASVSSNTSGSASMAATGFTASSSATSYYVTQSTSAGSVKAKAAGGIAGYVTSSATNETEATAVSVSGNGNKLYIPTTGVTASVSSNTSGSASMAATGMSPLSSGTSSYYVTLSTSAGSVKAKAVGNGTGIVTSSTQNETSATSVAVSGNNTKMYIPEATFANSATSGTTYTDKSSTGPVLISGDYLYINKGYTPDIKISLAKLVPDGSDVKGHGEYLLSGHSAYDDDGTLVAGTIPTLVASDLTVDGKTVTVPLGKYTGANDETAVSTNVADGAYSASVTSASVNTKPTFTPTTSGTVTGIATDTQPSGTDGTDYWTITPSGTSTNGNARSKSTATISVPGYIEAGSKVSSYKNVTITPTVNAGTASYIPKAEITGSSTNATATTTVEPGTVSISKQSTPSGVTNAASGNPTTTAPSSGVYVAVKATAAANTTGTTSSISGSGSATVSTAGYAPSTLTGSVSVSGTATAKTSAKDSSMTYVPITTASPAFDGGELSGTATASGTSCSISDSTNNSGVYITTACTTTRADVLYNGGVAGWVNKSDNTVALSSNTGTMTAKTYYVNGVTLIAPSSGTRTFSVTVPNGSSTATFTFNVNTSGNVTITES